MAAGSVIESLEGLPSRYRGDPDGKLLARFRLSVGNAQRDVVVSPEECRVEGSNGRPDAEISTSPATWLDLDAGRVSGIEAFAAKRLSLRGSIQLALRFEPLFDRPNAGGLRYEVRAVSSENLTISTVFAGSSQKPPLVLLHGLGATKASWLPVLPYLARRYRVVIPDLPGFGMSSKPRGGYDAPWFADRVAALLDSLRIERASFAGNSMGGRIAQEIAMSFPDRAESIACLCPATAFSRRPALALVRLLRPELGFIAGYIPRGRVIGEMRSLFARPDRVDTRWYEAAADDFLRSWRSPRARMAFFAAARHIYLEEPHGTTGFWERLRAMRTPAYYVFGWDDPLITPHFAGKVERFVPEARVQVWGDCGHAPQIEHPKKTARALLGFFESVQSRAEVS